MKLKKLFIQVCFLIFIINQAKAQANLGLVFTKADSLKGTLSKERQCFDILYYHLDIKVDVDNKWIGGNNLIHFKSVSTFKTLQLDLDTALVIEKIEWKNKKLKFDRLYNTVYVHFPKSIKANKTDSIKVYYSGQPKEAKNAPWDGGFVFKKTASGKDWVATASQGIGASLWWPCKDHQSDEPDNGMMISVSVPKKLKNISNGKLISTQHLDNGYIRYNWKVENPINTYNVALNISNYELIRDEYYGEKGLLTLNYWVLPENLEKAKLHFASNVKPMLKCMEAWFGPYPFYKDGYQLIETPFLGMEHQSAIAYGNQYSNGYLGTDLSESGWGMKWDFIIIHESGHEWFGNNITAKDIADMWIHESFTTYSEALFVEYLYGAQAAQEYVFGLRNTIKNDIPIIGVYNVANEGSGDMYSKGAIMLNTMRIILNDDLKWKAMLRGLNVEFYHQTVTHKQIVNYINTSLGINFTKVFNQYLHYPELPVLELKTVANKLYYRWNCKEANFDMPIRLKKAAGYQWIFPTKEFKLYEGLITDFDIDTKHFYIEIKRL